MSKFRMSPNGPIYWLNKLLNPNHNWFDYGFDPEMGKPKGLFNIGDLGSAGSLTGMSDSGFFGLGDISGLISSLIAHYTRNTLTGAENEQNAFNAEEAQKSRNFTEYMARNKYSMETQSMADAGVNPAMVYGGGSLVPTASNGAAASGSPLSGGDFGNLVMSLVRMPLELKSLSADIERIKADAVKAEKEGNAAIMNAETNRMNAGTQKGELGVHERQVAVQEAELDVHKSLAESNIKVNEETVKKIAEDVLYIKEQREYISKNYEIAQKNADSQQKQALAALRNADAAVQNAATNDYLSTYQSGLIYAQEMYQWAIGEGQEIVNKYADEKTKTELDNLKKEGVKLDAEGRLIDKQGNLVTAQTVKTYVNCATDVANSVSRFVGIGALSNASSSFSQSISSPKASAPYISPDTGLLYNVNMVR